MKKKELRRQLKRLRKALASGKLKLHYMQRW